LSGTGVASGFFRTGFVSGLRFVGLISGFFFRDPPPAPFVFLGLA
jgi:hypothetical protein